MTVMALEVPARVRPHGVVEGDRDAPHRDAGAGYQRFEQHVAGAQEQAVIGSLMDDRRSRRGVAGRQPLRPEVQCGVPLPQASALGKPLVVSSPSEVQPIFTSTARARRSRRARCGTAGSANRRADGKDSRHST